MLPRMVFACSCGSPTAKEAMESTYSSYIFTAFVKKATAIKVDGKYTRVEALFDVETTFKGNVSELEKVSTSISTSMCGLQMIVGERYVFVANEIGGVTYCSSSLLDPYDYHPETDTFLEELKGYVRN